MKELNKKMARFVELSKEFTTEESDIYEGFEIPTYYHNFTVTASSNGTNYIQNNITTSPAANAGTKEEQYRKYLDGKIKEVERYNEYKKLQVDLSEYFKSEEKLYSVDENIERRV